MALQRLLDAPIGPLNHPVGFGRLRRGEAMLKVEGGAQPVELVRAGRGTLMQTEALLHGPLPH